MKKWLCLMVALCICACFPQMFVCAAGMADDSVAVVDSYYEFQLALNDIADGGVIEITNDFTIYQALGIGKSLTIRAHPDVGEVTLISGVGRHFYVAGGEITLRFENIILDGNNISGGISSKASHLILDARIQNCVATDKFLKQAVGGGIYVSGGDLTITGGEISNNSANSGGGIFASNSNITLTGGAIDSNHAWAYGQVYGGGIYVVNGSLAIDGGAVTNNHCDADAGGVMLNRSGFRLIDGSISGNTARGAAGVYEIGGVGSFTINGGEIANNCATGSYGGIIADGNTTVNMSGGRITGNTAGYDGGGIYCQKMNMTGGEISGNSAGRSGGGIYTDNLPLLEIRGAAVVKDNQSGQAYYLTDPADIALHERQVDETVTWTDGFDYIYNNHDVSYTKGDPMPPQTGHNVTVITRYSDGSQEDTESVHVVEDGEAFHTTFAVPAGYGAAVTSSSDAVQADIAAGTIDIAAVSGDVTITITYSPAEAAEGHTVTVTTHYVDGVLPDETKTYTVPDGAAFSEPYDLLDRYELTGVSLFSTGYYVDSQAQTVNIDRVDRDYNFTLRFDRAYYTVTIVVRYPDGSESEYAYNVDYGKSFEESFEIRDGYRPVTTQLEPGFDIDLRRQTAKVARVTKDMRAVIICE